MKLSLIPFLMLFPAICFAKFPAADDIKYELDRSPYGQHVSLGTQLQSKKQHVLQAYYDFNRQGGAVGFINLLDAKDMKIAVLPAGAIVQNCVIHVLTPLTSGGSTTVAFSTGDVMDDIKPATAKASLATPDGLVACQITGGSVSTWRKLPGYTDGYSAGYTREYTPTMKVNVSALDGGKLSVWIEYILNR